MGAYKKLEKLYVCKTDPFRFLILFETGELPTFTFIHLENNDVSRHYWYRVGEEQEHNNAYLVLYHYSNNLPTAFWFIKKGRDFRGLFNHNFYSFDDILNFLKKFNEVKAQQDLLFNLDIFG